MSCVRFHRSTVDQTRIASRSVPTSGEPSAVRWSELVIVAFLVYAAAGEILPVASPVGSLVVLLNSDVILNYAVLIRRDSAKRTPAIGIIRDWLHLGLILWSDFAVLPRDGLVRSAVVRSRTGDAVGDLGSRVSAR